MLQTATIRECSATDFRTDHLHQTEQKRAHLQKLEDDITELAAHIDAATFRWLELIREFDECEGWAGDGLRSCAHWLKRLVIGYGRRRERRPLRDQSAHRCGNASRGWNWCGIRDGGWQKRFRGNVFELVANNRGSGIAITPKTPIPHWHGESLDDEIVMFHMLKREGGGNEEEEG